MDTLVEMHQLLIALFEQLASSWEGFIRAVIPAPNVPQWRVDEN
jgi:hypothetical protein